MPYLDNEKKKLHNCLYHAKNKLKTAQRVARFRRIKSQSNKSHVTDLSPNTGIGEINCNRPEIKVVTAPIVLEKQPVTAPVLTSRGVDKEALLATIRSKTSKILNTEFPSDGEPLSAQPKAEDDQVTAEPFYG